MSTNKRECNTRQTRRMVPVLEMDGDNRHPGIQAGSGAFPLQLSMLHLSLHVCTSAGREAEGERPRQKEAGRVVDQGATRMAAITRAGVS